MDLDTTAPDPTRVAATPAETPAAAAILSSGPCAAGKEAYRQQEIRAAAARGRARHNEEHALKYLERARRAAHGGDTAEARKATKKAMSVIRGMSAAAYELSHFSRGRETR